MKLHMIAAALALAAAGSTHAAIQNAASGNGELFAVVTSKSLGYSFVADLGINIDSFNYTPASSYVVDLGGYGQWGAFSAAVAGASDLKFGVIGLDSTGVSAGNKRMYTTYSAGANVLGTTTGNFVSAVANYDVWMGYLTGPNNAPKNAGTDMTTDVLNNGSEYADSSLTSTYFWGAGVVSDDLDTAKAKLAFSTLADVGQKANFGLVANASNTALKVTLNQFTTADKNYWTLDGSNLTYVAAVPEPETYALMLAGLGLVGYVARRRKSA